MDDIIYPPSAYSAASILLPRCEHPSDHESPFSHQLMFFTCPECWQSVCLPTPPLPWKKPVRRVCPECGGCIRLECGGEEGEHPEAVGC